MYKGFEELQSKKKHRVIISFRTEGKEWPDKDKSKYWVSNWLPQVELLAHPGVKGGITHCGLGGSLEFVYSGVPCLTFPHFGDQGQNARNLIEGGAALPLIDSSYGDRIAQESNFKIDNVAF